MVFWHTPIRVASHRSMPCIARAADQSDFSVTIMLQCGNQFFGATMRCPAHWQFAVRAKQTIGA